MNKGVPKIAPIDGMRGIAALLLAFGFHQFQLLGEIRTGPFNGVPVLGWLHDYGWTMVDLFFVVSGFVFSHVYLRDGAMRPDVGLGSFAKARFARLYPLHLATLLIIVAILAAGTPMGAEGKPNDIWHFVLNLLMLQHSGLNEGMSFNGPTWSVSVEIFCYIAFYIAAVAGRSFLPVFALCAVLTGALIADYSNPTAFYLGRGFAGFFAGYFLWRYQERLLRGHWVIYLLIAAIGLMFHPVGISYGVWLSFTAWPALLLWALKTGQLSQRPFGWLGDRSYSIYLLHIPVYYAVNLFLFGGEPAPRNLWWPALIGSWLLILLLSHFSYLWFEDPARRAIRDWRWGNSPNATKVELPAAERS